MDKKTVHFEVDYRVFMCITELTSELSRLAIHATDSYDFEDILNNTIHSLYQAQPQGQKNYGGKSPKIGVVRLSQANNIQPGNANIEYSPSRLCEEKWGRTERTIGTINLRERSYSTLDNRIHEKGDLKIPKVLIRDTEKVMECLGLTRKQKK